MVWELKSKAVLMPYNTEENGQVIRNLSSILYVFGLSKSHVHAESVSCAFQLADKTSVSCMAFNHANKILPLTYKKKAIPSLGALWYIPIALHETEEIMEMYH